jgi:hypothetical protein
MDVKSKDLDAIGVEEKKELLVLPGDEFIEATTEYAGLERIFSKMVATIAHIAVRLWQW